MDKNTEGTPPMTTPDPARLIERTERNADGEAMVCTGCGTTDTVAWIKASSRTAFTCCPERKMISVRDAITHLTRENEALKSGDLPQWQDVAEMRAAEITSLKAEVERLTRELAEASAELTDARRTIALQDAAIERLTIDGIHTCSERCTRVTCMLRRERDEARVHARELFESLEYADHFIKCEMTGLHNPARTKVLEAARTYLERNPE